MTFDERVGSDGLTPEEANRLRRVHDLLVEAGPPPELPPRLEHPAAAPDDAEVVPFPIPRRAAVVALAAAAMVAVGFGIGFLAGHSKARTATFVAERAVAMHGTRAGTQAVLRIAKPDSVGNWPMEIQVTGLPRQQARDAYYELWLTKNGRPAVSCGTFRVHGQTTTVRLTVPYRFSKYGGWIVTAEQPGDRGPGRVVLTS